MTGTTYGCGCGCCAGLADRTPQRLVNRPGLSEIAYRVGSYAQFRESMLAGLTRFDRPALAGLRTRDPGDLTIALLDAWAVAADVLTFYTERAANEQYLGTATERRSVAGIVGLIGYRLDPGVAAQTDLAFTLDTSPGSPQVVPIAAGAKVQTLPGPGELPQTFETVDDLTALADWNELLVRQTEPREPRDGDTSLLLVGAATGVNRGDTLLLAADQPSLTTGFVLARVTAVESDPVHQRTSVSYAVDHGSLGEDPAIRVQVLRSRAALFGFNAASPLLFVEEVRNALGTQLTGDDAEWVFADLTTPAQTAVTPVDLDAVYDGLTIGSPVVLRNGATTWRTTIATLGEVGRTAYGISAKVTRVGLDLIIDPDTEDVFGGAATRGTVVLLRGEELALAEVPITAPVWGATIALDAAVVVPDLLPRPILLRGHRARVRTLPEAEVGMIRDDGTWALASYLDLVVLDIDDAAAPQWHVRVCDVDQTLGTITTEPSNLVFLPPHADDPLLGETALVEAVDGSILRLTAPLSRVYDHDVQIWGNVVTGTHGESVIGEVLGSGDAAAPAQRFPLRHSPLTHVQAATASGGASTLRVSVDGVEWTEVATLFGRGPRERVFATTTGDDGTTTVHFGDGIAGARPPSGRDNITARYRTGTGLAGLAAADQLSLLMTRPLGVRAVRNPLPAAGAQDPQVAADAADNAPRTVLTLDRIVSLRDYADYAANVGGIGKAAADWTWDGSTRGVALTVAGTGGARIDPGSPLLANLTAAVLAAGNPRVPLVIRPAEVGLFTVEASLVLDPAYVVQILLAAARAALLDHFSFARRDFGQLVSLSEVDRVLHAVRGVTGVLVTRLHRTGEPAIRNAYLTARALVPGAPPPDEGAEILTADPDHLELGVAQ